MDLANLIVASLAALLAGGTLAYMIVRDRRADLPSFRLVATRMDDDLTLGCIVQVGKSGNADWVLCALEAAEPKRIRIARSDHEQLGRVLRLHAPLPIPIVRETRGLTTFAARCDRPMFDHMKIAVVCVLENDVGKRARVRAHGRCASPAR